METGHAFISYAKEDADQVRRLAARIREAGYRIWLDEHSLLPGQDWDLVIREAIRRSRVFILCLSDNAITKSGYIQREIREALAVTESMPEGKVFIIPVRLSSCAVPERLQRWQWIDLFKRGSHKKLLDALAAHLGAPARKVATIQSPHFSNATDHLLYELCLRTGRLFHGKLGKRYMVSQGHVAVMREDFPEPFRNMPKHRVQVHRLPTKSIRNLFPSNTPWRTDANRVHSVRVFPSMDAVELEAKSGTVMLNSDYLSVALLLTKDRMIYVTGEITPVYVEGSNKTQVVAMPLNLSRPSG